MDSAGTTIKIRLQNNGEPRTENKDERTHRSLVYPRMKKKSMRRERTARGTTKATRSEEREILLLIGCLLRIRNELDDVRDRLRQHWFPGTTESVRQRYCIRQQKRDTNTAIGN